MAKQLYTAGGTVYQHLQHLYDTYGYFVTNNRYVFCYDNNLTDKLFAAIRNNGKAFQLLSTLLHTP